MSDAGPSLHEIGRKILLSFAEAVPDLQLDNQGHPLVSSLDVQSERERFQLWAANIGLFAIGDRSFDYRARDNDSISDYTRKLLSELQEDLADFCEVLKGGDPGVTQATELSEDSTSSSDESEDDQLEELDCSDEKAADTGEEEELEPSSETSEEGSTDAAAALLPIFDDIVDIIDRLYRLAAKLRSATNRTPTSSRNFYRDTCMDQDGVEIPLTKGERVQARVQTGRFHARRIEEIIRQAQRDRIGRSCPELEPFENETSDRPVSELEPRLKALIWRVGRANAYRQQQFIFWRQREWSRRNAVPQAALPPEIPREETGEQVDMTNIPPPALVTPFIYAPVSSEAPSQTWKLAKDINLLSIDDKSSTGARTEFTATPTVYQPGSTKVGWPPFPKQLAGKKEFLCPYCFVTCPSSYRGKGHWRAHLIQDLQPYTCTSAECAQGDSQLLNTWEEWIVHEQLYHRTEYVCPSHSDAPFPSREAYVKHISSSHADCKYDLLRPEEIDRRARLLTKPSDPCVLCSYASDDWAEMDRHIASHLEALALLALPQSTGLENDDDAGDPDSVRMEKGDDDAVELLDKDVAGPITDLFEEQEHPADQGGSHRLTLSLLSEHQAEVSQSLSSHLGPFPYLGLPQLTGSESDDNGLEPDLYSIWSKNGDENAVELPDDDVHGPDLFQEQEHPADQGGSHELTIPSSPSRQAELSQHISEKGSDHAWDIDGDTSLHNTVISGSVEEVTRLIRNENCNIDALDQHGRSALHVALEAAPFDMIEVLLDLGADIRIPDTEGRTPLHLASAMGNEDAIALLLDYGADTSVKDNRGQSALHVAAAEGSAQSVRTLLLYGADVEGLNWKGQTPLSEAVARGDQTIIQILLLAASWYLGTTLTRENADIGSNVGAQSDEEWYLVASLLLRALQKFPQSGARNLHARLERVKATREKWEVAANQIPALVKLTYYEVVILLDNSGSMRLGQRINILYSTLIRVAEILTELTGKGVSLCPLNGRRKWDRLGVGEVANILETEIHFEGQTELGTRLRKAIVGPILLNREAWPHPMVTLIVTDGAPNREPRDTLQRTIRDYKNHPNRDSRSFFVLFQVGADQEATEFLETMRADIDVADMIFCCPQRLDDLYGSSQAACEVDKQYASYLIGILAAAVEKLV